MEIKIDGIHNLEKQNLVTQFDRRGQYDLYTCTKCGLKGKSRQLGMLTVSNRSHKKAIHCNGKLKVPNKIQITHCLAVGPQFANLTDGSVHEVVKPPKGYKNDVTGVWVMGVGEPVKVLANEYTEIQTP